MSTGWALLALGGAAAFVIGLARAAWHGQTPEGRWRPGAGPSLAVAVAGLALLAVALRAGGSVALGLSYPGP